MTATLTTRPGERFPSGHSESLLDAELPKPSPGGGNLVVRVEANFGQPCGYQRARAQAASGEDAARAGLGRRGGRRNGRSCRDSVQTGR
jgi:hypothetical protein